MADDDKKAENGSEDAPAVQNGTDANAAAATSVPPVGTASGPAPRFASLAQYIKDLSVENPNAPASLRSGGQPKIDINVGVNPKKLEAEGEHEVVLKLEAKAGKGDETLFAVELDYAGLFKVENMTNEQTMAALMIEAPRLLFPFAREVLANAVRQAGFPPLMIDPVDFLQLFRQRAAQAQAAQMAKAAGEAQA